MRKPIQLLIWNDVLVALCDDGSIHANSGAPGWTMLEPIPQPDDDEMSSEGEPAPVVRPWRPVGLYGIWCVDPGDKTAVEVPSADHFVRWRSLELDWLMVEASSAADALRVWRGSKDGSVEIDKRELTINGVVYLYIGDAVPF